MYQFMYKMYLNSIVIPILLIHYTIYHIENNILGNFITIEIIIYLSIFQLLDILRFIIFK